MTDAPSRHRTPPRPARADRGVPVWAVLGPALVLAVGVTALWPATAQEAGAPPQDRVALTAPDEAVLGRRLLMTAIGFNNDAVHDILDGVLPYDGYELQNRLASISAMMRAFPSLYRAEPDPWTAEAEAADPVFTSLALPAVWEDFPAFEAASVEAWQTALDASLAAPDDVLGLVEELEAQCESCHARFRRSFEFHDFDSLPFPEGAAPPADGTAP